MREQSSILWMTIGTSLATFLDSFDLSVANVALPYIAGDLGISVNQSAYVITSYMIGIGISIAKTQWLGERFGKVRLMISCILLFTFFSCVCGTARNIQFLSIARFLQGLAAGPIVPLSHTFITIFIPKEKRERMFGLWGAVFILSWVFGPLAGGWITTRFSWPWIFYINLPIGLLSAFLIARTLKIEPLHSEKVNQDWRGAIAGSAFVILWQILLDTGQQSDWWSSPSIRALFIASSLLLLYLIPWWWNHPKPFLNIHLFQNFLFFKLTIYMSLICIMDAAILILIPLWRQTYGNFDALWAGISLAPFGVGALLSAMTHNKIFKMLGLIGGVSLGLLISATSFFWQAYTLTTDCTILATSLPRFLLGFGTMLCFIGLGLLLEICIEPAKFFESTGLFHFCRSIFAAVGTTLSITLWQRRTAKHRGNLVDSITDYNQESLNFFSSLESKGFSHDQSALEISNLIDEQAALLALNDCLWLMGWMSLILAIVWILRFKKTESACALVKNTR
jgi:DHA2 family multidrug resistance protein